VAAPDDEYEKRYMDTNERVMFREKLVGKGMFIFSLVFGLVFAVVGLGAFIAGLAGALPMALGLGLGVPFGIFGAFMAVAGVLFAVHRIMVTDSNVHAHYGWSKRRIPVSFIESAKKVQPNTYRQGKVTMGLDGVVRSYVANSPSRPAVEITYQIPGERKRVLTVGSDHADDFVSSIEHARSASVAPSPSARVQAIPSVEQDAHAEAEAAADAEAASRSASGPNALGTGRPARS
jgi:hypothetical protein